MALSHLGGYLGASEAFLELWGSLGGLGVLLGLFGGILGPSWDSLGGLGVLLGLFWGVLGPSWGPLGALAGRGFKYLWKEEEERGGNGGGGG